MKLHENYVKELKKYYKNHRELSAMSVTPISDFDRLEYIIERAIEIQEPVQLATHYWELDENLKAELCKMISLLRANKYSSVLISEIMDAS